jgi:hypothetical protein
MLMEQGVGLLSSKMETRLKAAPDLRLLLELEPAPRVFFRNLADLVLRRPLPPNPGTSKPGRFWTDVFVPTGLPWGSFIESMLLHLALISVVATVGQSWVRQEQIRREIEHKAFLSYYMPSETFPTNRSRPPEQARPKRERNLERRSATRVAREQAKTELKPPDVRLDRDARLNSIANSASVRTPLFAPKLPQPMVPAGPTAVVAPAPEVSQATGRRSELPPLSVVAPAPTVGGLLSGRAVAAPNAAVVAPPPSLRSAIGKSGGANLGNSEVVAPSPGVSVREQRNSRTALASLGPGATVVPPPQSVTGAAGGRVTSGLVALVVPPPPSVAGTGSRKGSALSSGAQIVPPPQSLGSSGSLANGRVSSGLIALVVPPPPSVLGAGRSGGSAKFSPLAGSQVVPPAPTVTSVGTRGGSGRGNSLSDTGSQVVPPPQALNGSGGVAHGRGSTALGERVVPPAPTVTNAGTRGGSGMGGSLSGVGSQAVPPPQSINGSGGVANGRMGSGLGSQAVPPAPGVSGTGGSSARQMSAILGTGAQPVPPPPSPVEGGANGPGSGTTAAMDTNQAIPPPAMDNSSDPATIELPVRVIGLALALPTSSYFSNYEVFIAERRLKKGGSELIKLVSVSLPYQPRLSEYGVDNSKVYKLHVTRDPSCDESLLQMTWPEEIGPPPEPPLGTSTPAPGPGNGHDKLPCYRTTADEYWRALSGNR